MAGDWRTMGQGMRRRQGYPSSHVRGAARLPGQMPRDPLATSYDHAGRPEGTKKGPASFWDRAGRGMATEESPYQPPKPPDPPAPLKKVD